MGSLLTPLGQGAPRSHRRSAQGGGIGGCAPAHHSHLTWGAVGAGPRAAAAELAWARARRGGEGEGEGVGMGEGGEGVGMKVDGRGEG